MSKKPLPAQRKSLVAVLEEGKKAAPRHEYTAVFCAANEDSFWELSESYAAAGWEFLEVIVHQRHVTSAHGSGLSHGWMTFWKRIKKEKSSE